MCLCSSEAFKKRKKIQRPDVEKDENGRRDLRQISPQLHLTSVEKYFRRFKEIPSNYVQKHPDSMELVTKDDIMERINPLRVKMGRHIMLAGAPATSKASVTQKIAEIMADEYNSISTCHSMFIIDFRQHPGDPETSVAEFLYQTRPDWFDAEKKETMFGLMRKSPFKALFVFLALDTVPFEFNPDFEDISNFSKSKTSVIVHNILGGRLFPFCKILSSCREYRVREFEGCLRPDHIVQVGEMSDYSVTWMARELIGRKLYEDVLKVWSMWSGMVSVVNKTTGFYLQNLMSGAKGNLKTLAHSAPMCTVHLLVCCTWGSIYEPKMESDLIKNKVERVPILNKIKQVAYHAFIEGWISLPIAEVEERFDLTLEEIKKASVGYPHDSDKRYCLIESQYEGRYDFMCRQAQEFLCAIVIVELSTSEFKNFLRDSIHVPRYHVVRRMICGLVLDPDVFKFAYREKVIQADPKDIKLRRKLLESSMSAEYSHVKRQDLLEFMRSVCDAGEGGTNIFPKNIDVIDLSHIHLFCYDMHAIAMSLSGNVKLHHLNLANCDFTDVGLDRIARIAKRGCMQIDKLTLDWNREWCKSSLGITALGSIVPPCKVTDLSINHTNMTPEMLEKFSELLQEQEYLLPTLRISGNKQLCNDDGFQALWDFADRHSVEDLYVTVGSKATPKILNGLHDG